MKKIVVGVSLALLIGSFSSSIANAGTVTGNGGTAYIEYMSSSRTLTWGVKPATAWPYRFSGVVSYSYGYNGKTPISGTGFGWEGDEIAAPGPYGTYIWAELGGTAFALDGDAFVVLPGVGQGYVK